MARASFGGGGDYSGFFSGLYNANKSAARAEQDAKDADTADKWENGLITDDEWLEYIRSRIDAESDPKRNERWVEALRKYGPAIADAQMVDKYENGEITIGELITHYEGRISGLVENSNEHRQVTKILNDLKDTRDGQNLSRKAEELVNDIEAGKATYDDLLKLYKEQLKSLRPNSDLYKQVEGQIEKVNDTIKSNKIEGELAKQQYLYDAGKISSGTFSREIKKLAENFKTSDPARYWNLLRSAQQVAAGGGRSGGGGGGGGGSSSSSTTIDALQGERNRLWGIVEQIESGAKQGVDPATGQIVAFTPAYIKSIDTQMLGVYDQLHNAYMAKTKKDGTPNPDISAANNATTSKMKYIINNAQKHNTIKADEQGRNILNATIKRFESAAAMSDPVAAAAAVRNAVKDFNNWSDGLNKQVINNGEDDVRFGPELSLQDQVSPEYLQMNHAVAQALTAIANGDEASIESAIMLLGDAGIDKATINALTEPALRTITIEQAVNNGEMVGIYGIDGKIKWIETVQQTVGSIDPDTGRAVARQTLVPDPYQLSEEAGFTGDQNTKLIDLYVDQNGKPVKVQAVVQLTGMENAWYTSEQMTINGRKVAAGTRLSKAQVEWIKKQNNLNPEDGLSGYKGITTGAAINYYQTTINGQTWVQDPTTQLWYKDVLPLRGLRFMDDGYVEMNDNNEPVLDRRSYSSMEGVAVPYLGTDARAMQSIIDDINPDELGLKSIDANGKVVDFNPNEMADMYYSPVNKYTGFVTDPDSWWNKDQRREKSEKAYSRYTAEIRGKDTGDISFKTIKEDKPTQPSALEQLGKAFGISFGVKTDKRHQSLLDRRNIQKQTPKVNESTGFDLSKIDKGRTSGPSISKAADLPDVKKGTRSTVTPKTTKSTLPKVSAPRAPKVNKDTLSSNEMAQQRIEQQKSGGPAGRV